MTEGFKAGRDTFVDPRAHPHPQTGKPLVITTTETDDLLELHRFCSEGRLYYVEEWIREGGALQLARGTTSRGRRIASALEIALERKDHGLVLLLLCNGYDPDLQPYSPLDLALRARRLDLLDLLLAWGADPHRVDRCDVFDTYDSKLFERFRSLGVDLTADHALAEALAYHTSNKPLFGFAKRHRRSDPKIQAELNIALVHHAGEGKEKGVALCLWAGADPHAPAPSLRYGYISDDDEQHDGDSAVHEACRAGHLQTLERLGPDPAKDDFDELYRVADTGAVIGLLAQSALPEDPDAVIRRHLWWATCDPGGWRRWRSTDTLERLFELGLRWEKSTNEETTNARWGLLKAPDHTFVEVMKLLAKEDYCLPEIRHELARTPAMRRRMKEVGFLPAPSDARERPERYRPTRAREVVKKFGAEPPKPVKGKEPLPRYIEIGQRGPEPQKVCLDRTGLFELVWSRPVAAVAEEWNLSGPGLAKACKRMRIPVSPRGHWAKLKAGQKVRRVRLPNLGPGEVEEIVVWVVA
jgi:hypothetical protein